MSLSDKKSDDGKVYSDKFGKNYIVSNKVLQRIDGSLSDKIINVFGKWIYKEKDVKQAVKELKEEIDFLLQNYFSANNNLIEAVDKIFGEKLTK